MRLLNDLTICGPAPQLTQLLDTLHRPLAGSWRRDAEAEERLHRLGLPGREHCFVCTAEGSRPAAALWLQLRRGDELYVANIVPLAKKELSDDEYNLVLDDFVAQVIQPARNGLAIQAVLTPRLTRPEAYLSSEAVRRLRAFSIGANKSSLHPEDCRRWREFIIQCHLEGADLNPSLLEQWLTEEGWQKEQRRHIVCEYEAARAILAAYDEERLTKCLP